MCIRDRDEWLKSECFSLLQVSSKLARPPWAEFTLGWRLDAPRPHHALSQRPWFVVLRLMRILRSGPAQRARESAPPTVDYQGQARVP
eukprot:6372862-Pyramimonas_sp.AAC.1